MPESVVAHVEGIAGCEIEHGRKVREIAGPVAPGGDESGEVTEGVFGPNVDATLARVAGRKFDDRKCERRVENQPRTDPDDDRAGTCRCSGRDPAQADAGDHVEQQQITKAESFSRAIRVFRLGDGDSWTQERRVASGVRCGRIRQVVSRGEGRVEKEYHRRDGEGKAKAVRRGGSPQALKRRHTFWDLTARVNSCPSLCCRSAAFFRRR